MSKSLVQEWFEQPSSHESDLKLDNRTGITLGNSTPLGLLMCSIVTGDQSPSLVWIRNGRAVQDTDSRINLSTHAANNSLMRSSLVISNFMAADAGVYQCVFTDNAKVITSMPYRLDTGKLLE